MSKVGTREGEGGESMVIRTAKSTRENKQCSDKRKGEGPTSERRYKINESNGISGRASSKGDGKRNGKRKRDGHTVGKIRLRRGEIVQWSRKQTGTSKRNKQRDGKRAGTKEKIKGNSIAKESCDINARVLNEEISKRSKRRKTGNDKGNDVITEFTTIMRGNKEIESHKKPGPLSCDGRRFKKGPASFYLNFYVCHPSYRYPQS